MEFSRLIRLPSRERLDKSQIIAMVLPLDPSLGQAEKGVANLEPLNVDLNCRG
jgi:hypothetical protein